MGSTLYLLRQQPDHISLALFQPRDVEMDIVFVEQATSTAPSSMKGVIVETEGVPVGRSHQTMTYDDLVEKIFSSERIIVL